MALEAHRRLTDPAWRRHPNILAVRLRRSGAGDLATVAENKPNRAYVAVAGRCPSTVVPS